MSNPTGKLLDLMKHAVGLDHGKPKRGRAERRQDEQTSTNQHKRDSSR
jgi:hypothetical protein